MLDILNWSNSWAIAIGVNTILLAIAWILPKKLLTPAGHIHAWILGVLVWGTLSWQGYLVVMFYFLVGSAVTYLNMAEKEAKLVKKVGFTETKHEPEPALETAGVRL